MDKAPILPVTKIKDYLGSHTKLFPDLESALLKKRKKIHLFNFVV